MADDQGLLFIRLEGLPDEKEPDRDLLLERFLDYAGDLGLELYPAQEEAILELLAHRHVILNTPTGSGKSLVAEALHFFAMAEGRSSVYTAPTKALVNEKFFALCRVFGPRNVGLLTGDASVNPDAPIVCCTAEILANQALRQDDLDVDYVVMDEFHYYGDAERGVAWQIPLITMRDSVFLLMSATLGDVSDIESQLSSFTARKVSWIQNQNRPVPLSFDYRETPMHETIEDLVRTGAAPIYLVNFTQRDCAEQAQNLTSAHLCDKEEKQAIARELDKTRFDTPYAKEFLRFIKNGVGIHHAGLLPKYRLVVERLAQTGWIKVISGTDTLGVGVNIPIRTVLFSRLYKFDGQQTAILKAREFHQIAGRAGRKGFDDQGLVVAQAPEWVIENKRIESKISAQPHLKKKLVKKRPPPKAIPWDKERFDRLIQSPPEPLTPRFEITHGMIIHLLAGDEDNPRDGYRRLVELIGRSHGSTRERKTRLKRAATLLRSLVAADIVRVAPGDQTGGAQLEVRSDLQADFSLNHTLSLYLVDTLELLDPASETHALDALSLVEAILEDPRVVLYRQVDRLKTDLLARLKSEGVEYEERMARLEQVEHPKPNAEFIYKTFNAFADVHPWLGGENIRPKSIAREMFEQLASFNDYVQDYGLARSEGVLLRYLSQVYKTAVQTVPESMWTPDFEDILAYLHTLVRRTDASLLEEWELLVSGPGHAATEETPADRPQRPGPPDPAADRRAFVARIRNENHLLLRALGKRDFDQAADLVYRDADDPWTAERLAVALAPYFERHARIETTHRARLAEHTIIEQEAPRRWLVHQRIIDPEGDEDWIVDGLVDLTFERDLDQPLLQLLAIHD